MPNNQIAPPLPPWEKLLHRLHLGEGSFTVNELQANLLRCLTHPDEGPKDIYRHLVNSLPSILAAQGIFVVRTTQSSIALLTSNQSKKTALTMMKSGFLHRLCGARMVTTKKIPKYEAKTLNGFQFATCVPVGERHQGFQLLLLSQEQVSKERIEFLKLVRNILFLRYQQSLLKEQIDQEAESLTLLTHHLSEGMVVLDADLKVTLWNRPMQRLTGFPPREAVGQPYQTVFKRVDEPNWLQNLMNIYATTPLRNVFDTEFKINTRDETERWVSVSGSFMRRPDDDISQTIIIVRDVTQVKLLEERKNEFISIATHELRTPITAIKGYLSLFAKEEKGLSEKQKLYLQRATDANTRLVRLAEDLLRSVQVEEDRLRINLRPVDLKPLLEKVVHNLQEKAASKKIKLDLALPAFDVWVTADEEKIHQVFENLVDNAIKYTTEGEVRVSFNRYEENGQPHIITHVQDTGIGINSKNYETIFEKFRRTHNTVEIRESGAGLGLFIVKSFVEKQGGKISVNSKIGKGTTFSVRMPATESPKPLNEKEGESHE